MPALLAIDDDAFFRTIVSSVATGAGWTVLQAEDLAAASDLIDSADLIVLDLDLPDAKHLRAIDHVRAKTQVPIVVLSGDGGAELSKEALEHGATHVIDKTTMALDDLEQLLRTPQPAH